jgi:hypothetical protein
MEMTILGTKRKDNFEAYWQDEKDWLCTVEFLPPDDAEDRLFAAELRSSDRLCKSDKHAIAGAPR